MKTTIITDLAILIIATLCVNCNNNGDKDTSCIFRDIVLDTNSIDPIEELSLIGTWTLISYVDLTDCSFIYKPDYYTDSIVISFLDSINVSGYTQANDFNGKYNLENNIIQFIDLIMTSVLEPEWGEKFSNAIYNTDLVTIKNETLIIYYSQSQKAMIFSKN